MTAQLAGYVEILRPRVFPTDPDAGVNDPGVTTALVDSGIYPLFRDQGVTYWVMYGERNIFGATSRSHGGGVYTVRGKDQGNGEGVEFSSKRFGDREFAELLAEPVCQEGPEQRLRFRLLPVSMGSFEVEQQFALNQNAMLAAKKRPSKRWLDNEIDYWMKRIAAEDVDDEEPIRSGAVDMLHGLALLVNEQHRC
jgi:hypothetical protein